MLRLPARWTVQVLFESNRLRLVAHVLAQKE